MFLPPHRTAHVAHGARGAAPVAFVAAGSSSALQVLRECIEKCEELGIKVVELLEAKL